MVPIFLFIYGRFNNLSGFGVYISWKIHLQAILLVCFSFLPENKLFWAIMFGHFHEEHHAVICYVSSGTSQFYGMPL